MSKFDEIIFKKKKFSNILEEVYDNQKKKDNQINSLINELKPLINEISDATLIVPLIKEYLEIGVKNDDLLVKLAAIIQRSINTSNENGTDTITDEEKEQLLNAAKDLIKK